MHHPLSTVRSLTIRAVQLMSGLAILFALALPACADPITVAVFEDHAYDAGRLASSQTLALRNEPAPSWFIGLDPLIRDRLIAQGTKIVPERETEDHLVIVERDIKPHTYRMSSNKFPVNRSIDIIFCYDPNSNETSQSRRCNHLVFELYAQGDYDFAPLFEEIWRTMMQATPVARTETYVFRPSRLVVLELMRRM